MSLSDSPCISSNLLKLVKSNVNNFVKSKANDFFNLLVYGQWRQKTVKECDLVKNSVLWLLGKAYFSEKFDNNTSYCSFLIDFKSRIWFSYREEFAPLLNLNQSNAKSDCGWGCMLRCAQMMFANAILIQNLSRDWVLDNKWYDPTLCNIIKLFEDCIDSPFGIHRLLQIALERQLKNENINNGNLKFTRNLALKIVGKWFAPSEAISLLKEAACFYYTKKFSLIIPKIYLSIDNTVIIEELETLSENWNLPIIFVVSVRLGTKHVNDIYYNQIKNLFSIDQCCGAIGGQPNKAYYFIGNCGDNLYYLDPHTVQKYQPLLYNINETTFNNKFCKKDELKWKSFHNLKTSSISISKIDPSIAIGFLCQTKNDFDNCIHNLTLAKIIELKSTKTNYKALSSTVKTPLFTLFDKRILQTVYNLNELVETISEDGFEVL